MGLVLSKWYRNSDAVECYWRWKKSTATGLWLAKAGTRFQILGNNNDTYTVSFDVVDKINDEEIMIVDKWDKNNMAGPSNYDGFMVGGQHNDDHIISNKGGIDNSDASGCYYSQVDGNKVDGSGRQGTESGTGGNPRMEIMDNVRHSGDRNGNKKKHKNKQKNGNNLATRVTLGFKDKNEGQRKRTIENVYGKNHKIDMLSDTHVNMH